MVMAMRQLNTWQRLALAAIIGGSAIAIFPGVTVGIYYGAMKLNCGNAEVEIIPSAGNNVISFGLSSFYNMRDNFVAPVTLRHKYDPSDIDGWTLTFTDSRRVDHVYSCREQVGDMCSFGVKLPNITYSGGVTVQPKYRGVAPCGEMLLKPKKGWRIYLSVIELFNRG